MQTLLPLIPDGATRITDTLNVFRENNRCTYFSGIDPVFSHPADDHKSFKLITAMLVNEGSCSKAQIVSAFAVSESSIKRAVKKLRDHGADSFYLPRKGRGGTVFTPVVLEKVQARLNAGASRDDICSEFNVKRDALKKAISSGRLHEPTVVAYEGSGKSERSAVDATYDLGTACSRSDERILAALGKLQSASLEFETCCDVTCGGVLCALPFLEAQGLFAFLPEYFSLPPGYYDVIHVVLLLAYMALCRIRTIEQLRFESPGELGKLLGLDRIPEVKTLREKIRQLCDGSNSKEWMLELSRFYMQQNSELAGVLYIDGHVRLYHGSQTCLPRRFVSRQRLCLRGTTDYYVNDALGQPFFVVSKTVNEGMIAVLESEIIPQLLEDIPSQPTEEELEADPYLHRFILVFDREASSRRLFKRLWANHRIACISYQKNVTDSWSESEFHEQTVPMPNGETIQMRLAERGSYLGRPADGLWVKEVRKLTASGHQTSIISTAYAVCDQFLAAYMFSRWSQENFFGYMMREYNIDRLIDYDVEEFPDPEKKVVNPEYRAIEKQVRSLRSKINTKKAKFANQQIKADSGSGNNLQQTINRKAELREEIDLMQGELDQLKEARKAHPSHIEFKDLPDDLKFQRLAPSRKCFVDTIKMLAYRAETAMATILRQHLGRDEDARRLVRDLLSSEADLKPDHATRTLNVYVHRMTNPQADRAVQRMIDVINETEPTYPGSEWRIRHHLVEAHPK